MLDNFFVQLLSEFLEVVRYRHTILSKFMHKVRWVVLLECSETKIEAVIKS